MQQQAIIGNYSKHSHKLDSVVAHGDMRIVTFRHSNQEMYAGSATSQASSLIHTLHLTTVGSFNMFRL